MSSDSTAFRARVAASQDGGAADVRGDEAAGGPSVETASVARQAGTRSGKKDAGRFAPGEPFCGKCGYALKGLTTSSSCPECGTPFVEGLVRGARRVRGGYRFRTAAELWGLPLIHIAFGPDEKSIKGKAVGIIAIGDQAYGLIAIGGVACGGVCFGGVSLGVASIGGCSAGLLSAVGGCAVSGGVGVGGMAIGTVAMGGMAVGVLARGAQAVGPYTASARGWSNGAQAMFAKYATVIGSSNGFLDLAPAVVAMAITAGLGAAVGIVCLLAYRKFARGSGM